MIDSQRPSYEHMLHRVGELEQSNRRWKSLALGLGLLLLLAVIVGGAGSMFLAFGTLAARNHAMDAVQAERAAAMQAMMEAEKARKAADEQREQTQRLLDQAKEKKEPRP